MNFLEALGLKFCGYWDRCFFVNNTKESGLIVEDKDGNRKYLSYFELNRLRENNS